MGIDCLPGEYSKNLKLDKQASTLFVEQISNRLTANEIADAECIFYLSRNRLFPEFYETELERVIAEHTARGGPRTSLNHIAEKTNLHDEFVRGLSILGATELAESLKSVV